MSHAFLVDSYETERLKTLSVWTQVGANDLGFRIEPRARTPLEHMVHQCLSEEAWMRTMLGIDVGMTPLPDAETRMAFLKHYAAASGARLAALRAKDAAWFDGSTRFFSVDRTRAWVLVRRLTHSAHHRGQLGLLLRARGHALYSTYGPTADTGGLAANGATVSYRYRDVEELLELEERGGRAPALPGPGSKPTTERP